MSYPRPRVPHLPPSLPQAEKDSHGLQPLPAPEAREGLREEPVCGGAGEETTGPKPQPHRNSGKEPLLKWFGSSLVVHTSTVFHFCLERNSKIAVLNRLALKTTQIKNKENLVYFLIRANSLLYLVAQCRKQEPRV